METGKIYAGLFNSMGHFATETFPDAGPREHLLKLKEEADEAIAEPHKVDEYADCLLALFGAAFKAGIDNKELLSAATRKFEIVRGRTWERMPDGTYQHVKPPNK